MLCIEVELLAGRYAATAYNDRGRAEWPPHPARFFSALVAALHDNEVVDETERAALCWLERQEAPAMRVDLDTVTSRLGRRQVRDVFVPVNDITVAASLEPKLRAAEDALQQAQRALQAGQAAGEQARGKALSKLTKELQKAQSQCAKLRQGWDATSSSSDSELAAAKALLPEHRTRQMRTFPVVFPAAHSFRYVWLAIDPESHVRSALDRLCARVTRLGHSSSFVRCVLVDEPTEPNLIPDASGEIVLRTVGAGQLQRLEREYERHQAVLSRVLPARPQRYRVAAAQTRKPDLPHSVFSEDWVVFERVAERVTPQARGDRLLSPRPLSSRGPDLASALRRALIEAHGAEDLPESLSGHARDGSATRTPHLAFAALPHVNHAHADGSVKGIAIILPRSVSAAERSQLFALIAAWERDRAVMSDQPVMELGAARLAPFFVQRVDHPATRALSPATWCGASTHFVTATPILLDRYPGNLRSNLGATAHKAAREAEQYVSLACVRVGLPQPSAVEVSLAPLLSGSQAAHAFAAPSARGKPPRARVHADIRFAGPVRGPILLGAGRFFGLGLCLPM